MAEDKNENHCFLDGNPEELQRLQLGQDVIKAYMGKPVFAPIDFIEKGIRVLDSATADGAWLQDLRESIGSPATGSHTFIGTDITDIYFPRPHPEGISLYTQSMTRPWPEDWASSFDLVHQRMALAAASKAVVKDTLRGFVGLVKPGGWIQLVEPDHSISKGPAMADFFRLLSDVFAFMKTGPDYAPQLKAWLADLGLVDIEERIFDVPIGKISPSAETKVKSTRMMELVIKGLAEVAKSIPTSFSAGELQSLGPRIRDEVTETGGVFRLYCVTGVSKVGVHLNLSGGGGPDGIAVDLDGGLIVAQPGLGVLRFDSSGILTHFIQLPPGSSPSNISSESHDSSRIMITDSASGTIFTVDMPFAGYGMQETR